jgi:hypothetical protein
MAAAKRIEEDVLAVLRLLVWKDGICTIAYQLDRKLYDKVNKVLTALGGKWNRKLGGHEFKDNPDAETAVRESIATGMYLDAKQAFQFFETPPALALQVANFLDRLLLLKARQTGDTGYKRSEVKWLEPSAGTGNLCWAMDEIGYTKGRAMDVNPTVLDKLKKRLPDIGVVTADFLQVNPTAEFDAVLMNPPFSNLGDVRHVLHALKFVKAGGALVAIMCPAWTYRGDEVAREFRAFIENCGERAKWELLPEGSFKESGTGVRTGVLSVSVANEWRAKPAIPSAPSAKTSDGSSTKRKKSSVAKS